MFTIGFKIFSAETHLSWQTAAASFPVWKNKMHDSLVNQNDFTRLWSTKWPRSIYASSESTAIQPLT